MKFGKQLQLGIYPPWKDYYIQYSKLKRIIERLQFTSNSKSSKAKTLEKVKAGINIQEEVEVELVKRLSLAADETTPLTLITKDARADSHTSYASYTDGIAMGSSQNSVDGKVAKKTKGPTSEEFFDIILEEMKKSNNFFVGKQSELRLALETMTNARNNSYLTHHTGSDPNFLSNLRTIYIELTNLINYSELSKMGFNKIIKKYDKALGTNTLHVWQQTIDRQPFTMAFEAVQLMDIVTSLVSRDKLMEWDRLEKENNAMSKEDLFPAVRIPGLVISIVLFLISYYFPVIAADDPCAQRCMSLLTLTLGLWITEAIPYYATGILVPILVTVLRVLKDPKHPGYPMEVEAAANFCMSNIFNHTTLLLLGGYTISTAFARCQLELRIASILQRKFGDSPQMFILAVMFLGLFLSMWISNHTAPILCATIILPVVRDLPSDSRFSKTLLLGLAYACNYGGMMTPISSMQNVLAVSYLQQAGFTVSFGRWICVSLPFGVLNTVIAWAYLIMIVKPDDIQAIPVIVYERGLPVFGKRNVMVIATSLLTILLFANFTYVKEIFGEIGIVAAIYVGFMFGSGVLSEVDFNSLSWHTIFLVGGGNVLGKAVTSSGLLGYISAAITDALPLGQPWMALVIILMFCLTAATFVSHTVASLILMPVIATLGISIGMPEIAVMGSAFAVSAAMALPFSSFPNVNSVLIVDDFQRPYLTVSDFIQTGLPLSVLCVVLIATFGYILIKTIIV